MLVIFDLDGTLWHDDTERLCEDTEWVLEYLTGENHTLALASYNPDAQEVLDRMSILHRFTSVIGDYSMDKYDHVTELMGRLSFDKDQVIFFDDDERNVKMLTQRKVRAHLVDSRCGITLEDINAMGL